MHCFIGYDAQGIGRVYAQHNNCDVAETWCIEECFKYIRQRRETGPFKDWIVLKATPVTQGACRRGA
jgi:hypothetical protein